MQIKEIRTRTGLSQANFSEKYSIPKRTIEDWETEKRTPPDYVLDMLTYIVASENVNHKAWVFYEYRDRSGFGSYELFTDKDAAIAYAKDLWDSMTEYDQKSYLNDPAGEYCVAEMDVEWDSIEEKFVPSLSEYTPVWPKSLSTEECRLAVERFLKQEVEKGQDAWEMVQDGYDGDIEAYIKDYINDYVALNTPDGITISRLGYNEYFLFDE